MTAEKSLCVALRSFIEEIVEEKLNGGIERPVDPTKISYSFPDGTFISDFEKVRTAYPGSKRGIETEYANFRKKYPKEFRGLIPLLLPAIEKQKMHKDKLDAMKAFVPNWKNFKTWINNRCWEEEPEKEVYVKS